ncbi:DUF2911 domain-containing protein [Sphingobacterium sp. HJSM2_6]|uniref:DUF2911 domain-containing protein n=1 Tax=Sphingobacterium sp. HJSM2_6 TaxID=3366264 RepID=UPI003BBAAD58
MKATTLIIVLICTISTAFSQIKLKAPKTSPTDSSHVKTNDGVQIMIKYGSPSLKGRAIGTDLATFGQRWRTGANETTTVTFDQDVTINGKKLAAGKYGLNTIPGKAKTTLIFNKNWDQWGTKFDESADVLKLDVDNKSDGKNQERLKINAEKSGKINLNWGDYGWSVQVKPD